MASGTVYGSTNNQYVETWFDWQSVSNGSESNTSTIHVQVYARRTNNYTSYGTGSGNVNINGTNFVFAIDSSMTITTTTRLLFSTSTIVSHNDDGTKACYIAATWSIGNIGLSAGAWGGTYTLDTIPRYAGITSFKTTSTSLSAVSFSFTADRAISGARYMYTLGSNAWSNWIDCSWSGSSGNGSITGIPPNTYVQYKVSVKSASSGLWTESNIISATTKDYARLTSSLNFNSANNLPLTMTNAGSGTLSFSLLVNSQTIISNRNIGNVTAYTISFTTAERNAIHSAMSKVKSAVVQLQLTTNSYAYLSYTGTCTITNANPTFSAFSVVDSDETCVANTGNNQVFIRYRSNARISVTAAVGQKGASIVKYVATVGTKSVTSTSTLINIAGVDGTEVSVTAVDSRGNQTVVKRAISLKDYFYPVITLATATRANGVDTTTTLNFSGSFWNKSFGAISNRYVLQYRYKRTTESEYGSLISVTSSASANNVSAKANIAGDLGASGFDSNKSFDIQVRLADTFAEKYFVITLDRGIATMKLLKEGVEVNGYLRLNDSDVATQSFGTWTPSFQGTGWAYTTQSGTWFKIGNMVIANAAIYCSKKPTTNINVVIQGLPFARTAGGATKVTAFANVNSGLYIDNGSVVGTTVTLRRYVVSTSVNGILASNTILDTFAIECQITYFTN